jgi:hypothetical protein
MHVATGDVAIRPLFRWQFRGITLFAAQPTEVSPELLKRSAGPSTVGERFETVSRSAPHTHFEDTSLADDYPLDSQA